MSLQRFADAVGRSLEQVEAYMEGMAREDPDLARRTRAGLEAASDAELRMHGRVADVEDRNHMLAETLKAVDARVAKLETQLWRASSEIDRWRKAWRAEKARCRRLHGEP